VKPQPQPDDPSTKRRNLANAAAPSIAEMIVEGISKSYETEFEIRRVLDNCSFGLASGKLTVLIGPSGCGKSTLINIMAGYEKADMGTVTLDGRSVDGPSADRLVVFQETALFPWMTTFENVAYGPRVQRQLPYEEVEARVVEVLERVGLREFRDKYPKQLSGGMQRRAELARALINRPRLMLLDEPFRGLDAMTRELMQEYYLRLYEGSQQTTLFVTSEIDEPLLLADTLLIMTNRPGRIAKVLDIALPRPREQKVLTSEAYLRYKGEALEVLHAEALKAFAGGSKAAADFLDAYERDQS
jgi:NitT/TauT family transport system ATP-binding protein